jgi:hypothetical protein
MTRLVPILAVAALTIGTQVDPAVAQHPAATEQGVLVVRHRGLEQPSTPIAEPAPPPTISVRDAMILNGLQDHGLIAIRPVDLDRTRSWWDDPKWKYTPKTYQGFKAKPDRPYQPRPGWLYDDQAGWRYRHEPAWAQRPGAVADVLSQLPTTGPNWYVTRWR